jgi:putative ABC transport system permease protein
LQQTQPAPSLAIRTVQAYATRHLLAVSCVAACVALFAIIWSIYQGAYEGAVAYLRSVRADVWVLQRSADNLLRGFSVLPQSYADVLARLDGVESVGRVVTVPASVAAGRNRGTVFLVGYDTRVGTGRPPHLVGGRLPEGDDEIVLDRAIAARLDTRIGSRIAVDGTELRVVGLSRDTNAIAMQYAFVTIDRAQSLLPLRGIVTAYLLRLAPGTDAAAEARGIRESQTRLAAYTREEFIRNNLRQLDQGFLPVIMVITGLSAIVLTIMLSLILSMSVLERRRDFAIMKILGAPGRHLWLVIVREALLISSAGLVAGAAVAVGLLPLLGALLPQLNEAFEPWQAALVAAVVELIAVASGSLASLATRKIYPLEAFEWRQ